MKMKSSAGPSNGDRKNLYDFQKRGVEFLNARDGRALLADEMGLGKTVQALSFISENKDLRPVLVVCPSSLKLNWKKEASHWTRGERVVLLDGMKPYSAQADILIINYDILSQWIPTLRRMRVACVIFDEAHYLKNHKAKRTKAAHHVCHHVQSVIGLTGTPIINRPVEFYSIISLIEPSLFPSRWKYLQRYCGLKHTRFGWDASGSSHTEELHGKLTDSIMLRRMKADVLKDLPPKTRSVVPITLDNDKEYRQAEKDFIGWLKQTSPDEVESASKAEALVRVGVLKRLCAEGKLKHMVEWIRVLLDSGEKLVAFCTHRDIAKLVHTAFANESVCVHGGVSKATRFEYAEAFQTKKHVRLFVSTMKAGGVGLTLTAASNVCFTELGWSPGDHDQAEDRVHRIGQKAESINVWYLLSENTIETNITKVLDKKRGVLKRVLDGEEQDVESMLSEILAQYKEST